MLIIEETKNVVIKGSRKASFLRFRFKVVFNSVSIKNRSILKRFEGDEFCSECYCLQNAKSSVVALFSPFPLIDVSKSFSIWNYIR